MFPFLPIPSRRARNASFLTCQNLIFLSISSRVLRMLRMLTVLRSRLHGFEAFVRITPARATNRLLAASRMPIPQTSLVCQIIDSRLNALMVRNRGHRQTGRNTETRPAILGSRHRLPAPPAKPLDPFVACQVFLPIPSPDDETRLSDEGGPLKLSCSLTFRTVQQVEPAPSLMVHQTLTPARQVHHLFGRVAGPAGRSTTTGKEISRDKGKRGMTCRQCASCGRQRSACAMLVHSPHFLLHRLVCKQASVGFSQRTRRASPWTHRFFRLFCYSRQSTDTSHLLHEPTLGR